MSFGDAYTLGVRLTGDITSLRQELQAGTAVISEFAQASTAAMARAAGAMEQAAGAMTSAGNRAARATEAPVASTRRSGQAFEDYMRRATRAQDEVARTSESSSQRTSRSLDGIGMSLGRLTGFAGFALLARQVWQTGMGFNEFTQNTQIALTTLLGTQEAARGFLDEIMQFALQTPYAFDMLTEQAQKLITYGFRTEEIIPILRATGDAATAMGKGSEGISRMNLALGQIQTAGRLRSQELLQLSEVGVNGLAILANQAGVTTNEFQTLVTAGMVPAEEAIAGLVQGINDGTDGINGQTAAFGGLMAQIKGAGGITATLDSAKSGFRNAASAVTDALVPAYTGFLRLATQGLGVVRDTANVFNGLPGPVQSSALAFAATALAVRLLNVQGRATGVWRSFQATLAASRANASLLGYQVNGLRTAMIATRAVAGSLGASMLSAFGGPVGLAVAAVAAAVSAFAASSADAKARAESFAEALKLVGDEARAAVEELVAEQFITGADTDWGWFQKWTTGAESAAEAMASLGLSVNDVAAAVAGPREGFDELIAQIEAMGYGPTINEVLTKLHQQRNAIERQTEVQAQLNAASATGAEQARAQGVAYQEAVAPLRVFTEEQEKAIAAAEEAAGKTVRPNLGALSLNVSTEKDVERARLAVEDATLRLRDAEDDRAALTSRDEVTARDRERADRAVEDARRALAETTESLADVEARTDPVANYRRQVEQIITDTRTFVADIQALADQGLNAIDLQQIIQSGPEGSADVRKALLGDPGMIDFTNEARETIEALAGEVETQARLAQVGLDAVGQNWGGTLGLAMRAQLAEGAYDTVEELARALGEDPQKLYDIGMQYGLSFLNGLSDAMDYQRGMTITPDGGIRYGAGAQAAYASGGIYPGYTPGRDIGYIAVSGGEAIMRPEWTRAVGSGFVHRMNALAAGGGVEAVRRAMGVYLGGFASGGIAPQVVTVPVRSTNERYSPVTIQHATFTDPAAAGRYADRARPVNNIFGG